MDNHRAALWCWLQYFNTNTNDINLFHVDRHTDTLQSNITSWVNQSTSPIHVENMGINDYLVKMDGLSPNAKLFRWDNYASIFLEIYKQKIGCCSFATHDEGDDPNHSSVLKIKPWLLPDNIDYFMENGEWICNIDLDYFCYSIGDEIKIMHSDDYIRDVFTKVKLLLDNKKIKVLTVCFSPECCGGWANSEKIWGIAQSCLQTTLVFP